MPTTLHEPPPSMGATMTALFVKLFDRDELWCPRGGRAAAGAIESARICVL